MFAIAFGVILALFPLSLHAQVVGVRAADHVGFSRVAFDTENIGSVDIRTHDLGIEVRLSEGYRFSGLDSIFNKMKKEIVQDFEDISDGSFEKLLLICDCVHSTSIVNNEMVVLDLEKRENSNDQNSGIVENLNESGLVSQDLVVAEVSNYFGGSFFGSSAEVNNFVTEPTNAVDVEGFHLDGIEEIPAAVVLQDNEVEVLDSPLSSSLKSYSLSDLSSYGDGSVDELSSQTVFRNNEIFQRIESASLGAQETNINGNCEVLNFLKFDNYLSGVQDVAEHRSSLALEADKFSEPEVIKLSLAYLSLGLGTEAVAALDILDEVDTLEVLGIRSLSLSLDGGVINLDWLPENLRECDSVSVWSALSEGTVSSADVVVIRSHFADLPAGIKGALAFRLGSVFLQSGHIDAARYVSEQVEDLPEQVLGQMAILKSRIHRESGNSGKTNEILLEVVRDDQSSAPEALFELTEESVDSGQKLGPDVKELISSYIQERPNSSTSVDLLEIQLRNEIRELDFKTAWKTFANYQSVVPSPRSDAILNEIGVGIYEIENDVSFLRAATDVNPEDFGRMGNSLRAMIVERISELGFDAMAKRRADRWNLSNTMKTQNDQSFSSIVPEIEVPRETGVGQLTPASDNLQAVSSAQNSFQDSVSLSNESSAVPLSVPLVNAVDETSQLLKETEELYQRLEALGY